MCLHVITGSTTGSLENQVLRVRNTRSTQTLLLIRNKGFPTPFQARNVGPRGRSDSLATPLRSPLAIGGHDAMPVGLTHPPPAAVVTVRRTAAITSGMAAAFPAAMMWAPATPGMRLSSSIVSMQILRP